MRPLRGLTNLQLVTLIDIDVSHSVPIFSQDRVCALRCALCALRFELDNNRNHLMT